MDPVANNYDSLANVDSGFCSYGPGPEDPQADEYGCTDPLAENYDSNATIDDGSCSYAPANSLTIQDSNDIDDLGGICDPSDPNCEA